MTQGQSSNVSNDGAQLRDLIALTRSQATLIDDLNRRVVALENERAVGAAASIASPGRANDRGRRGDRRTADQSGRLDAFSRRRVLLGAAAAVGAAAVVVRAGEPAAAATGDPVRLGNTNDSSSPTLLRPTTATTPSVLLDASQNGAGSGILGVGGAGKEGVTGRSDGSGLSVGVLGISDSGYALFGQSTSGYDVYAGGRGRIGMGSHAPELPPTSGDYPLGDIVRDSTGNMFVCVVASVPAVPPVPGSPAIPAIWRKIAGPQSAGQLHFLPTPAQAAETRSGLGVANTAPVPMGGNVTVNVGVTVPAIPVGTTAVIGTIGAFSPSGPRFTSFGNLAVVAGGAGPAGLAVSFLAGNDFASALYISALSSSRTLSVFSYGSAAHVSMDVIGYFR